MQIIRIQKSATRKVSSGLYMKFEYYNPTRLIFAAGALARLGEVASHHGKRALLVTGGGSPWYYCHR